MSKRYNYVIGDVQGCFEALKELLTIENLDDYVLRSIARSPAAIFLLSC